MLRGFVSKIYISQKVLGKCFYSNHFQDRTCRTHQRRYRHMRNVQDQWAPFSLCGSGQSPPRLEAAVSDAFCSPTA